MPRQAEVARGVPGRLRPRIFSTFGPTRVVGRQPNAPAAFTPGEILDTHFQRLSRPQGTWFCQKEPRKKSQVTSPGIDPANVRLVAQRLNHYATPGPTTTTTTTTTTTNNNNNNNNNSCSCDGKPFSEVERAGGYDLGYWGKEN